MQKRPHLGWIHGLAALACVLVTHSARADIYGFIDDKGVIHFAHTRVDERYSLFFKEGERYDTSRMRTPPRGASASPAAPDANVEAAVPAPVRALDPVRSRFFERVSDHPNVKKYATLIGQVARESGVDPHLIQSVIAVESGYNPSAVSPKGAIGLMQVMPDTGERYGVRSDKKQSVIQKLTDPAINLRIGARYLADLRKMFREDLNLVLAAYNAGENAVKRYRNAIPPFPETMAYVKLVGEFYRFYKPPAPVVKPPVVAVAETPATQIPTRVRMNFGGRRNMPDLGRLPPAEALQVPALPTVEVVPVPDIPNIAEGAQTMGPAPHAQ